MAPSKGSYAGSRERDFARISKALASAEAIEGRNAIVVGGDSLEHLKRIPDHTVSLILTDPPYHSTKKRNIVGDRAFEEDSHFVEWMEQYAVEWKRILRPNGSAYVFCASEMSARLEVMLMQSFNVLAHIVWTKPNEPGYDGWKQKMKKEALRQFYSYSERVLFLEPACEGNLYRSNLADFLRKTREEAGLSQHELTGVIGAYGKVNHGGAVSNWEAGRNTPSQEQYARMAEAFIATGKVKTMPAYEDVVRAFDMDSSRQFTDIWTFMNVRPYKGKHPAEKPLDLLEHAIQAASYPDDIVLDCFAGSGSTAVAALRLGRRSISMEIEPRWIERITETLRLTDLTKKPAARRTTYLSEGGQARCGACRHGYCTWCGAIHIRLSFSTLEIERTCTDEAKGDAGRSAQSASGIR